MRSRRCVSFGARVHMQVPIAAKIFGRLEDSALEFTQQAISDVLGWPSEQFEGVDGALTFGMIYPIDMNFIGGILDLCVRKQASKPRPRLARCLVSILLAGAAGVGFHALCFDCVPIIQAIVVVFGDA
jgi:hypothetical protein